MILSELLEHFNIDVSLPEYLYVQPFNDVFAKGKLLKSDKCYKIIAETIKDVIHTMIIYLGDDYPLVISSELPNGKTNGIKFGKTKDDLLYI